MAELLREVGTILIVVSALLATACVVAHHVLSRWRQTSAGVHAFTFEAALAATLDLWAIRLVVPDGDWFQFIRLAAFAAVPVVLGWRLAVIISTWRSERRKRVGLRTRATTSPEESP